jgi:molybdopterin-guanine dinucleotide biosynthesis protein A
MLTLAVQAGGRSSRMGTDKALLPFLGRSLIQRVIERLAPIADEILVTTNRPDDYLFLGLPLYPDLEPGRGALGGFYTALQAASYPLVAMVACDMPFASRTLLAAQRDLLLSLDVDLVIPSSAEGLEPLHAVYRCETCLPAVRAAMQTEDWKLISWFPRVRVHTLLPEEVTRLDPGPHIFMNVNTPADLQQAEAIAREDFTLSSLSSLHP